jgi:hypothetical protein
VAAEAAALRDADIVVQSPVVIVRAGSVLEVRTAAVVPVPSRSELPELGPREGTHDRMVCGALRPSPRDASAGVGQRLGRRPRLASAILAGDGFWPRLRALVYQMSETTRSAWIHGRGAVAEGADEVDTSDDRTHSRPPGSGRTSRRAQKLLAHGDVRRRRRALVLHAAGVEARRAYGRVTRLAWRAAHQASANSR